MDVATPDRLTFAVDSNVLFALEPHLALSETEPYELAARFVRLIQEHGHLIAVPEAAREDIERDSDYERRAHRGQALGKYRILADVPLSDRLVAGLPQESANDAVDAAMAAALEANAAHYFVTEDRRLRRRLARVAPDLAARVVSLAEAVERLDALHPEPKTPPPLVERVRCYQVALEDPIFESIRDDYGPTFDSWYTEKCQRAHREAFVIRGESQYLAGLCILKDEDDGEYGLPRRRLKLCTLKVAEAYRGQRLGEQLVKAALDDAIARRRTGLSVTVFEKHVELIGLLSDLGFEEMRHVRTGRGELVFFRSVEPPAGAVTEMDAFEFNRRYGPHALNADVPIHIIPIQPRWEERLFPEGRLQLDLLGGSAACGNGLRKAYLSGSLNRKVARGDLVLLYRSGDFQAVRFVTVVEDVFASANYLELGRFVGTRTVYTLEEMRDMTKNGGREVIAILMRQARKLEPAWQLQQLRDFRIVLRPPQSIQAVPEEGALWVRSQLAA